MSLTDVLCRESRPEDRRSLVSLWSRIFGDQPELVETFLDLLPEMGNCCVAESRGRILGAAYLIHGFVLHMPGSSPQRCGYLYAVATEEDARGNGIGTMVSRGAVRLGKAAGAERICTLPAEAGLYNWYARILSLTYTTSRTLCTCTALPPAEELSAEAYGLRREALLQDKPHVTPDIAALRFQQELCLCYGGGFYASGDSLFCGYREDDGWVLRELLTSGTSLPDFQNLHTVERPYLCSDLPFPDPFIWNLTLE